MYVLAVQQKLFITQIIYIILNYIILVSQLYFNNLIVIDILLDYFHFTETYLF